MMSPAVSRRRTLCFWPAICGGTVFLLWAVLCLLVIVIPWKVSQGGCLYWSPVAYVIRDEFRLRSVVDGPFQRFVNALWQAAPFAAPPKPTLRDSRGDQVVGPPWSFQLNRIAYEPEAVVLETSSVASSWERSSFRTLDLADGVLRVIAIPGAYLGAVAFAVGAVAALVGPRGAETRERTHDGRFSTRGKKH
jgi:hypothetical protein